MDIVSLWDKTLQLIKGDLTSVSFNTFFKNIVPLKIHLNDLILLAPSDFNKDILENRYLHLIEDAISQLSLKKYNIKFVLSEKEVADLNSDSTDLNYRVLYPNLNPK